MSTNPSKKRPCNSGNGEVAYSQTSDLWRVQALLKLFWMHTKLGTSYSGQKGLEKHQSSLEPKGHFSQEGVVSIKNENLFEKKIQEKSEDAIQIKRRTKCSK